MEYIKSETSFACRDNYIQLKAPKTGEYYLFVEFMWQQPDTVNHFTVSCYGDTDCWFVKDERDLFDKSDIVSRFCKAHAKSGSSEGEIDHTTMAEEKAPKIDRYSGKIPAGYNYFYYEN